LATALHSKSEQGLRTSGAIAFISLLGFGNVLAQSTGSQELASKNTFDDASFGALHVGRTMLDAIPKDEMVIIPV
jgi:hypothetical protein